MPIEGPKEIDQIEYVVTILAITRRRLVESLYLIVRGRANTPAVKAQMIAKMRIPCTRSDSEYEKKLGACIVISLGGSGVPIMEEIISTV